MTKIRKAVFPVAGLGTRFLPATKAMPKELLPIIDKPVIQFAVEEAIEAGITDLIFITGRTKRAIEDHFDGNPELEAILEASGKTDLLERLRSIIPQHVNCVFVRQAQALGLGHAILCAEAAVGGEPFAVLLPDNLMAGDVLPTQDLIKRFEVSGASCISVSKVAQEDLHLYGVIKPVSESSVGAVRIEGIVEKPSADAAPSDMAAIGRYVFTPDIFDHLRDQAPGVGGEIQLTDSINAMAELGPVDAVLYQGKLYDCGSRMGYLEATLDHALAHPEFGARFAELIRGKSLLLRPAKTGS
ncbi:MAG: UTP--glucose-1-phosphate uridylyltransferase [Polaromonas sp.]|jgi:UTP--glucose-1-phosphate uridylyltransferase